jgi:Glycosyl transferase family 2
MSWGERPPGELVLEPQDSPHHQLAPWFKTWRDDRRAARERYATKTGGRAARKRRAVVTMVHNEPVFLPIWLEYHSRFFRPEDIYVLDNDSTDGSTDGNGFVRIPAPRDRVDAVWTAGTIGALQHELLESYDVVLVCDVDEIVAPVPEWGTLGEYLDHFDEGWVNALCYEMLHMKDREPPLRLDRPILDQRSYWFSNDAYNKAVVTTAPMEWRPGLHGRADYQVNLDPDLRMIHLHRMDYGICLERHRSREDRRWADEDERESWAVHNRITADDEFERWFYEDSCFEFIEIKPEEIRATWRGLF